MFLKAARVLALGGLLSLGCDAAMKSAVTPTPDAAVPPDGPVAMDQTLAPPPAGQGFQFKTMSSQVPAGTEVQDCYFFQVPGAPTDEVYVNRVTIAQNAGTHHLNVFRVKTIKGLDPAQGFVHGENGMGECFKSPNWADWPLVSNSQSGGTEVDWKLPEGVANKFKGGDWLMVQSHFVNGRTQATPVGAHAEVNFWTVEKSKVTAELGTLFATNQSLRVCKSSPTPSFDKTCHAKGDVKIVAANGHFHSRGKQFSMYSWDGTSTAKPPETARFYTSDAWDDPPMSRDLTVSVPNGGGIWYTCDFQWQEPPIGCDALNAIDKAKGTPDDQLDCCYRFGGLVDANEHCNAFVYYYPKTADTDVFCN